MFRAYWIKHAGRGILGGFSLECWSQIFGFPVESHFNYPEDGRLHYSYKKQKRIGDNFEFYMTAFQNKIKIKSICSRESQSVLVYDKKMLFNLLLPTEQLSPLNHFRKQEGACFHFPVTAISLPIPSDAINLGVFSTTSKLPNTTDIVIDVEKVRGGVLNVSAFIANESYVVNFSDADWVKDSWIVEDTKKTPKIGIYASICR